MPRRDRQRAELEELCRTGAVARAVDLAFAHFAEFGRDEAVLDALSGALDRAPDVPSVRRRFIELRQRTWARAGPERA